MTGRRDDDGDDARPDKDGQEASFAAAVDCQMDWDLDQEEKARQIAEEDLSRGKKQVNLPPMSLRLRVTDT